MNLYVMRHGIAFDRRDPACPPDPVRPLTEEGRDKTRGVAFGLAALEVRPQRAFTSPYLRARETAQIVLPALGLDPSALVVTDALLPFADSDELLVELGPRRGDAICFGHAPHVNLLLSRLTDAGDGVFSLKKAGVAALEVAMPFETPARLLWLLPPKAARALAKAPVAPT